MKSNNTKNELVDILGEKEAKKFSKDIISSITHSLIQQGVIKIEGIHSPEQLFNKLYEWFKANKKDFSYVVDHRSSVLKEAFNYLEKKDINYSIIFFAMYFEHSINNIIVHAIAKKNKMKKTEKSLLRANLTDKFEWILEILDCPVFNLNHKKTILACAEERNKFVHYKWQVEDEENQDNEEKRLNNLLKSIKKAITYMKRYESNILYENNKKKTDHVLKKMLKH